MPFMMVLKMLVVTVMMLQMMVLVMLVLKMFVTRIGCIIVGLLKRLLVEVSFMLVSNCFVLNPSGNYIVLGPFTMTL